MDRKVGERVAMRDGTIGHIESIDDDGIFCDVRALTPNNEPSCCVSMCYTDSLTAVPDTVVPMPRSKEWWAESRAFCAAVEAALSTGNSERSDG